MVHPPGASLEAAAMNLLALPVVAVLLAAQVPPPLSSAKAAEPLRTRLRVILDGEAARLEALATRLATAGQADAAATVRHALPPASPARGARRFVAVPEVVPALPPAATPASAWQTEFDSIRAASAKNLFDLATQAASTEPRHYALADLCLREVVARQRDHAEARRLLGQVPHRGGWATPYAVSQFKDGKIPHPVFGWVKASWVPHLTRGELPSPLETTPGKERWMPAAAAEAQRQEFDRGWKITTEHFTIQTNVPLAQAIVFGRHLETLHEVFESLFADVLADRSSLAQRFRSKSMVGEKSTDPHMVSYFATREEYARAVSVFFDVDPKISLGYYHPPQGRGARRGRAYFFRDEGGVLEATATLFHEGSHQLLFESGVATPGAFQNIVGNYWVFEGLGTYFETLTIRPGATTKDPDDVVIEIGGLVGARNEAARVQLLEPGALVPLATFVALRQKAFNADGDIVRHYLEASVLAAFLLDGQDGRYRDGFLDYVRDACQGRLGRASGRSVEGRLDTTFPKLQAEFRAYLEGNHP
jgi:hypothetical protein